VKDKAFKTNPELLLSAEEREKCIVISNPELPDNPLVFVSEEFERQTGYSASEVLGRNCRFLQGPETDETAVDAIRSAVRDESQVTVDILNYRKDGSTFWNRLRIRPLRDEEGRLVFFAGAQNPIPQSEVRREPRHGIEE